MENNQPLYSYGVTSAGLFSKGEFQFHFNPNGFYNNKNSWISDDLSVKIIWDTTLNAWKLSGSTLGTTQVINKNPNYPPINDDWNVVGANYSSTAKEGECPPINTLKANINFNNPTCSCNGTINVSATGGVAPYQYSYDNGFSYIYSPIKTDLCGGTHIVKIKDSVGTIVTQTITMSEVEKEVTYRITMKNVGSTKIDAYTWKYSHQFLVDPILPPGVTLTFDLILGSTFFRYPYITSATASFIPQVKKNTNTLVPEDETIDTTEILTIAGCQGATNFKTNYSFRYKSITLNSTDTYTIDVISSFKSNCYTKSLYEISNDELGTLSANSNDGIGPLSFDLEDYATTYRNCCNGGNSNYTTALANNSVSGCNCCKTNYWDYYYNRS